MMLYAPAPSITLSAMPVPARKPERRHKAKGYVVNVVGLNNEPRLGDFWVEKKDWSSATRIDYEVQHAMLRNQAMAESRVWVHNLMTASSTEVTNSDIYATVRSVRRAIAEFGPNMVNLRNVDVRAANPQHLIAVLRASFPWKEKVTGWSEALAAAPGVLQQHNLNPRRELAGLHA